MANCAVSFRDTTGIVHTVTLSASSAFEAAAKALELFSGAECTKSLPESTPLEVTTAEKKHLVTREAMLKWASRNAKSPREMILKERIKAVLKGA